MKRYTHVLIAFFLVIAMVIPVYAKDLPVVQLLANPSEIKTGDTLTVQTVLQGFTGEYGEISGVEVELVFDPTLLQVQSISQGNIVQAFKSNSVELTKSFNNNTGSIKYAFAHFGSESFSGTGTLMNVEMKAIDEGQATISLVTSIIIQKSKPGKNVVHQTLGTTINITATGSEQPVTGGEQPVTGNPGSGSANSPNDMGNEDENSESSESPVDQGGSLEETNNMRILEKFNDKAQIEKITWASSAIAYLTQLDVLKGDGNGNFRPNDFITREEFASAMSNMLDLHFATSFVQQLGSNDKVEISYVDMNPNMWSYQAVKRLAETGLMQGKVIDSKRYFDPKSKITRGEIVKVLMRYVNVNDMDAKNVPFIDIQGHFAEEEIKQAYTLGIVTGKSLTSFAPNDFASRAELAVMLYKTIMVINKPIDHRVLE